MSGRDVDYVGLLDMTDAELESLRRKTFIWMRWWMLGAWIALLASVGSALMNLWKTGQGGSWHAYWDAVNYTWPFFGMTLSLPAFKGVIANIPDRLRVLRSWAAAGDEEWAPPAARQPEALSPQEVVEHRAAIGPLRRPTSRINSNLQRLAVVACDGLGFGVVVGLAVGGPSLLKWFSGWQAILLIVLLVLCAVGGVGGGVWGFVRVRRLHRSLYVVADEWGLRWRRPLRGGDTASIAWHGARAFYILVPPRAGSDAAIVIEGGDAVLAWRLSSRASTTEYDAATLLMRLVATRSHLPLRDLSGAYAKLPDLSSDDMARLADDSPATPALPQDEPRRRVHPSWYPVFAALFLFAMLYVSGRAGQFLQSHH